jgi:hypothetical protein
MLRPVLATFAAAMFALGPAAAQTPGAATEGHVLLGEPSLEPTTDRLAPAPETESGSPDLASPARGSIAEVEAPAAEHDLIAGGEIEWATPTSCRFCADMNGGGTCRFQTKDIGKMCNWVQNPPCQCQFCFGVFSCWWLFR